MSTRRLTDTERDGRALAVRLLKELDSPGADECWSVDPKFAPDGPAPDPPLLRYLKILRERNSPKIDFGFAVLLTDFIATTLAGSVPTPEFFDQFVEASDQRLNANLGQGQPASSDILDAMNRATANLGALKGVLDTARVASVVDESADAGVELRAGSLELLLHHALGIVRHIDEDVEILWSSSPANGERRVALPPAAPGNG